LRNGGLENGLRHTAENVCFKPENDVINILMVGDSGIDG
jgi:hypothetical protein